MEQPVSQDPSALPEVKLDYAKVLSDVQDREKDIHDKWVKEAEDIFAIYLGGMGKQELKAPFNILYSNTEIIVPAVFSKKPTANVMRRWDEQRADVPAKAMQRMLSFGMDSNIPSYPDFMTAIEDAVLDAALPGQGQARLRIVNSLPVIDYVQWKKYIWGFCERWEDKPWEAFRADMKPRDALKMLGIPEGTPGDESDAQKFLSTAGTNENVSDQDSQTKEKKPETVAVYELWNKQTRMVDFLCDAWPGKCMKSVEDPLKLENFFCTPPKPLFFVHSTTDTLPKPLYNLYKEQAEQLNTLTRRIKRVTQAIQVRGLYASQVTDIPKIFEGEENSLIPTEVSGGIMRMEKGLDSYIWMVPIDKYVVVLKELIAVREQVKSTIYEILGIGDILRGVSKASETLGAQQIKDKWGSLRVNKARERTTEFIRSLLRLMGEGAAKHTPADLWAKVTGMPLATPMQADVMQNGPNPQPVPQQDTWDSVLTVLRDDLTRAYTIDIEPNSSVDSQVTTEQEDAQGLMTALGQALNGLSSLAQQGPEGFEAAKAVLIGVAGKFQLGQEIEPQLRAIKPPQAAPNPEMQKKEQDLAKKEQDLGTREQQLSEQEANLKTINDQMEKLLDEIANQQKGVSRDRQDLIREHKNLVAELANQTDAAVLKIEAAGLKVDKARIAAQKPQQPQKRPA